LLSGSTESTHLDIKKIIPILIIGTFKVQKLLKKNKKKKKGK